MNKEIMIFEEQEVELFELKGEILFNPYHVAVCLDIADSTLREHLSVMNNKQVVKVTNDMISGVKDIDFRKLNNAGENFLTEIGLVALLSRSRKCPMITKRKILQTLLPNKEIFLYNNYKEIEFFMLLEQALQPFELTIQKQFPCLSYKIDGYILEKNIAIEYDENNHNHYSVETHQQRQVNIENKLNCKFIRINDNDTHSWNIGYVIKNIFNLI